MPREQTHKAIRCPKCGTTARVPAQLLEQAARASASPPAEEPIFRKLPLAFGAKLTIKAGENLVSIAVVDQVSKVAGFARTTIITP